MLIFKCELAGINLVSTNRKFKTHPKYINAKEHLTELFKFYKLGDTCAEPVAVKLYLYTAKDIDNNDKLIHDALEGAKVIKNDELIRIKKTHITRPEKKNEKEKLIIEVSTLTEREWRELKEIDEKLKKIKEVSLWETVKPAI